MINRLFFATLLGIFVFSIGSCGQEPVAEVYTVKVTPLSVQVSNPKLLIVFYAWGRNNLIYNLFNDIEEMASNTGLLQSSNIDIVLCISSWDDYYYTYLWKNQIQQKEDIAPANYWYSGVYYYNNSSGNFERVYYNGDRFDNTATAAAMMDNLNWVKSHFETSNVWLNLWDHGANALEMGTNDTAVEKTNTWSIINPLYIGYDEPNSKSLSDDEIVYSIQQTLGHVKVLSFDACEMMVLESIYTYKDIADWFVGSMGTLPGEGYNYYDLYARIAVSNDTAFTISKQIVDSYYDYIHTELSNYFDTLGGTSEHDVPYMTAITKEAIMRTIPYIEQTYDYLETLTNTNFNWMISYEDYISGTQYYYASLGVSVWYNRYNGSASYHTWFYPVFGDGGFYTSIAGSIYTLMTSWESQYLANTNRTFLSNIAYAYENAVENDPAVMYFGQGKPRYGFWSHKKYYGQYSYGGPVYRPRPKYFDPNTLLLFRDYPKVYELLGSDKYNINDHRFDY
ncbi:MAG: hypothetical protein HPY53_01185 [Brevinematales bacterium]|nr:hypothetical protein [Brevinematales bacterium]